MTRAIASLVVTVSIAVVAFNLLHIESFGAVRETIRPAHASVWLREARR